MRRDWEADRIGEGGRFAPWRLATVRDPENHKERGLLDNELFTQLAKIIRVPREHDGRFRAGVSSEVDREWYWYGRTRSEKPSSKFPAKQLARLIRLSSELHETLHNVDQPTLERLTNVAARFVDTGDPDSPPAPHDLKFIQTTFPSYVRAVGELAEYSQMALSQKPQRSRRRRGRPAGHGLLNPYSPGSFNCFVLRLLWDAQASGGVLSLDKNFGKGTLVDALNLLRPHLPPKLIPKALPLSTLAKIKALDKKIGPHPEF